MEEVRDRVDLVKSIGERRVTTFHQEFDVELVFVQLRKILELIAFASLTANKEEYSAVHDKFATHWKAKAMLRDLQRVNRRFYPMPVGQPQLQADGIKHMTAVTDGFLTRDEFEFLYDKACDVLHTRNPFSTADPVLSLRYSVKEWVSRIETLLRLHMIHLVSGSKWIVQIPSEGPVRVYSADPLQQARSATR
ncbi:MAG TPA: hypothetical protein VMH00_11090 [Candidatus Limnocylindrales bacterium]|nr:hypothetical protein [Candidatus Limnocylindrales bacterium]